MARNAKLGKIIIAGVVLIVTGIIVAIGLGFDDGKPEVQPLDPDKAEAVRKVMQNRSVIARYQTQARAMYNVNEYAQTQFYAAWEETAKMPKAKRDAERKQLIERAKAEIKKKQDDFNRDLENHRSGGSATTLNTLRQTAYDNLDLGLRIATLTVARQETALRERKMKFEGGKDKLTPEKRSEEEAAIKRQQDACNRRKGEINLVKANRNNVVGIIIRQAGR